MPACAGTCYVCASHGAAREAQACQGVANEMVYNTYANIRFQLGGADGSVKVRPMRGCGAQRRPHMRARPGACNVPIVGRSSVLPSQGSRQGLLGGASSGSRPFVCLFATIGARRGD